MEHDIAKASRMAQKAMRKSNREKISSTQLIRKKEYSQQQYQRMLNNHRRAKKYRMNKSRSNNHDRGLLLFILLIFALIGLFYSQLRFLATLCSLIMIISIMDRKIEDLEKGQKGQRGERGERTRGDRIKKNTQGRRREEQARLPSILEKTIHKLKLSSLKNQSQIHSKSFTEFPYRR